MAPQDSFIDDEDDTCPLCIEEFDLSDRNFRPCPCGYQICQFCFNNLKNNLNGLCPACRRPYDEKTIQWKVVTQEEEAEFRLNIQKNQKKRATEQRQKEVQKREAEKENRKNLVGVRVVQKNLVYVTGLTPTVREDELLKTLRKPEFFGQYGNIQKISISNRKSAEGQPQSLGIYVTFEKKEDAARCIQAVNGSQNGDRVLKAQLGTTKYCSAWLRHEQCGNRQCMFLHELGDEEDSYTRQDLSSLNSVGTQRPLSTAASSSSRSASRQAAPLLQATVIGSQPMVRTSSKDESDAGEGPALPATASWARTTQQRSRRGSYATSGTAASPAISQSMPAAAEAVLEDSEHPPLPQPSTIRKVEKQPAKQKASKNVEKALPKPKVDGFDFSIILKILAACPAEAFAPPKESEDIFPPLFDIHGGQRRRALRVEEENRSSEQEEPVEPVEPSEEEPESGSLALGGEPEDGDQGRDGAFGQRRNTTQPPIQRTSTEGHFSPPIGYGQSSTPAPGGTTGGRSMTPQQFQQTRGSFVDQMPPGINTQQSSLFQGQGHSRGHSRYSFANEGTSNSTKVNLVTDPRIMAQQTSMMPSSFRAQPGSQFYGTSIPGPPPGLKSTGTPPVGGMFGQGHAFGGSGFNDAATLADKSNLLQLLNRGRTTGSSSAHDAGKLDLADPSILQARMQHQQQGNAAGVGHGLFGGQSQDDDDLSFGEVVTSVDALVSEDDQFPCDPSMSLQPTGTMTPIFPPGFDLPQLHPLLSMVERSQTPASPAMYDSRLKNQPSTRPGTPLAATPLRSLTPHVYETPTKPSTGVSAKSSIKELAAKSGLSSDIAAQAAKEMKAGQILQDEDFPTLGSVKTASPLRTKSASTPRAQDAGRSLAEKKKKLEKTKSDNAQIAPMALEKRPPLNTLDIAAATKSAATPAGMKIDGNVMDSFHTGDASAAKSQLSSALPSAVSTPTLSTANTSSPQARAAPKTLRLVQTPKTETPPAISPAALATIRAAGIGGSNNRPAAPAHEINSETASMVSASVSASRTSSPPPISRIGAAAVRTTTKSQQRKERKEASKKAVAQIAETTPVEAEVEIAPILGRKKKQKKEKKITLPSAVYTRPQTPQDQRKDVSEGYESPAQAVASSPAPKMEAQKKLAAPTMPVSLMKSKEAKGKEVPARPKSPVQVDTSIRLNESTKTTVLTPDYVTHAPEVKNEQPVEEDLGDIPSISEVLHKLVQEHHIPALEHLSLFRSLQGFLQRTEPTPNVPVTLPPNLKSIITKEDEERLNAFQPVRKTVNNQSVLLTPNGDCLLNLSQQEADRFLELQDRLRTDSALPTAFAAPRYTPASGFSLVKNRAVPNGTPSFFPAGPDNYPSDPVGKMHREEAISCINQHVLPSLNLGNYKTMGANPNFTKNVNLQQLAPWIYPPADSDDQRRMFSGRPGDDAIGPADYGSSPYDDPLGGGTGGVGVNIPGALGGPSPAIGSTPLMSVDEAETVWGQAKKQHEAIDKKLRQLLARNRRLLEIH
ncbi:CCR4-NOT transcription complex subunit 4 [Microdochium nivale]|nr:CCR4-NOT transcription complex subunit 4 [Microdochium nivale]